MIQRRSRDATPSGADGNVSPIIIPGGLNTQFTGLGTFYGDSTQTQRIGIVPDITVLPTIEGLRHGKDEVLEMALNCNWLSTGPAINDPSARVNIYPNPVKDIVTVEIQCGIKDVRVSV